MAQADACVANSDPAEAKVPLGRWEGSTENATVATALLSDLVERGLDPEQGILFGVDGGKALRKAVRDVFGEVPVQRCIRHKARNVTGHLAERDRPQVKARLGRDRPPTGTPAARGARRRARRHPPRRRRLTPGGHAGDVDRDPPRHPREAAAHPRIHERVRVDGRDHPAHPAQRQTLVKRRDGTALDRRRDARSRATFRKVIGHRDLAKLAIPSTINADPLLTRRHGGGFVQSQSTLCSRPGSVVYVSPAV